ncbi:positive regulator of purine utilization [Penicillium capsulatum]|uniref:Positive regulator of purine utilization n=1 Tax=Penicillium capsulatum TaxID=69766 RepID=A0A9W9IV40_9EURO|nr:positive regulator of purine utilization [Penicillium capsulatum]KAJ6129290.1 positive regulator of purine utilization [Penicillium capsulatum]
MPGSSDSDRAKPMSPTSLHGHASSPPSTRQDLNDAITTSLAFPSSFRNVSACYRCRARKHRCDQRLPRCGPCEKSQIRCVGYDPITKEEIPRSYVYFLENRVRYLNALLVRHNIDFKPATAFEENGAIDEESMTEMDMVKDDSPGMEDISQVHESTQSAKLDLTGEQANTGKVTAADDILHSPDSMVHMDDPVLDLLVGKAAKRAVMEPESSETSGGTSIRTSFFGLRGEALSKECAILPSRDEADLLVGLYFAYTNFHLPVLHYDEFQEILDRTYGTAHRDRSAYHLYTLFIVFAIGAAAGTDARKRGTEKQRRRYSHATGQHKKRQFSSHSSSPEEFHASAMAYLARSLVCLSSSDYIDNLRELQAMILLSGFALLRPTRPGLGRLVDVAMSSAIDLKLYCDQESEDIEPDRGLNAVAHHPEWMTDWRRRLWWCVYSLERLVAPYLGRPFSIPDDVITTDFPSTLEDKFITRRGFLRPIAIKPTYKHTARHYFKLRILQSEIYSMIQYQKARLGRKKDGRHQPPSIFLESYPSFSLWRKDISYRLDEWKASIPARGTPGVWSCVLPMELDYWKAVIMLYRWSVKIPSEFISERGAFDGILHGFAITVPAETDLICIKAAEACQKVLHIYRGLQNMGMISAIRIAIQDVFTAGKCRSVMPWRQANLNREYSAVFHLEFFTCSPQLGE